ncbi:MAG: hypothetical protein JW795_20995 [Chitinivibrionales bacterium]|nr:hypothetical protein [Chitinivibrionales bacterium]
MADCEVLSMCPFFNDKMAQMPAMADILKKQYCRNNFSGCARYIVRSKLGKEKVPADLYPNESAKVNGILNKK